MRTRVAFEEDEAYLATSKQVLKMVGEKVAHHMLRAFGDVQLKTYEQYQFVYRKFIEAIGVSIFLFKTINLLVTWISITFRSGLAIVS